MVGRGVKSNAHQLCIMQTERERQERETERSLFSWFNKWLRLMHLTSRQYINFIFINILRDHDPFQKQHFFAAQNCSAYRSIHVPPWPKAIFPQCWANIISVLLKPCQHKSRSLAGTYKLGMMSCLISVRFESLISTYQIWCHLL